MKPISEAQLARGQEALRARMQAVPTPKYLNLENALMLGQPIPLVWDGVEYQTRPLSYRDGSGLQIAMFQREYRKDNPAKSVEDAEDDEAEVVQMLALFHSFLVPVPEVNPFADAAPEEVGALLGFFLACLMMQRGRSRLGASQSPTSMRSAN